MLQIAVPDRFDDDGNTVVVKNTKRDEKLHFMGEKTRWFLCNKTKLQVKHKYIKHLMHLNICRKCNNIL